MQASPGSFLQSLSVALTQALGQKPSVLSPLHLRGTFWHLKVHRGTEPEAMSAFSASKKHWAAWAAQSPSQVSPTSTTPLPHLATQSPSLVALQPSGQQPSL